MRIDLLHRDEGTILATRFFELAWRGWFRYMTPWLGFVDADDYWECTFLRAYVAGPFVFFWKQRPRDCT